MMLKAALILSACLMLILPVGCASVPHESAKIETSAEADEAAAEIAESGKPGYSAVARVYFSCAE